jgi:hypothetical protein
VAAANHPPPDLDALNPDELKALIFPQREQLLSRDNEIEHLKLHLARLRRQQFAAANVPPPSTASSAPQS